MLGTPARLLERRYRTVLACAALVVALIVLAAGAAVAQELVPGDARDIEPLKGSYLNLFWLILLFLSVGSWGYLTGWMSDDATGVGLNNRMWTSIMLGVGAFGLLLTLMLHGALAFVFLAGTATTFGLYVRRRNEVVPEQFRLFSGGGGEVDMGLVGEEGELSGTLSVKLTNAAGESLEKFLVGQPGMAGGAAALAGVLGEAVYCHARAIRFEPGAEEYPVLFDMDGVFARATALKPEVGQALLACVARFAALQGKGKAVGKLTAETEEGEKIEVIARGIKSKAGPAISLGLPDWTADIYKGGLSAMGMHKAMVERIKKILEVPGNGILLTGKPSSGKTSTLHGIIGEIDIFTTDVVLLEKTKVHELEQVVRREVDLDSMEAFEPLFGSVLREDPNVVAVDEMKSPKIVAPLFEYAAGGGRLLATMQATGAADAVERLAKGGSGALLAKALTVVLNQRLLRKLCENCKEQFEPNPQLLAKLQIPPQQAGTWFKPVGCEQCLRTGYKGRTAIYEMLVMSDPVREVLKSGEVAVRTVRKAAGAKGIRTMHQDGLLKVQQGTTSLDELRRVLKDA